MKLKDLEMGDVFIFMECVRSVMEDRDCHGMPTHTVVEIVSDGIDLGRGVLSSDGIVNICSPDELNEDVVRIN